MPNINAIKCRLNKKENQTPMFLRCARVYVDQGNDCLQFINYVWLCYSGYYTGKPEFFSSLKWREKQKQKQNVFSTLKLAQTDIAQLEWFDIQEKPLARILVWHSCNSTLQFTIVAILKISISYDCRRANVYVRNLFLSFSLSKMSSFFRSFIFSSFWGDWFMLT